jgi:predicted nuclease of predicted toxin-antitoxin system
MHFLVDENLPSSLVKLLQERGHDVLDIAKSTLRGSKNKKLWLIAASEKRILITRNLDFPIPKLKPLPAGVILIRVPYTYASAQITTLFEDFLNSIKLEELAGKITVVTPGRVRFRKL